MTAQAQQYIPVSEEEFADLQREYADAMAAQQADPRMQASHTTIGGLQNDDNLIKWQLEVDSILERIEHMLRGDRPKVINGSLIFVPPEKVEDRILNEFGIGEVMRILSLYLNRNTILSNYDENTINWKILDLGKELADLFFLKYEAFGLDTLEKRKLYPMLIKEIIDPVHSAYLRALNGGERESLRMARQINQQETIIPPGYNQYGQQVEHKKNIFKPWTWIG